MKGRDRNKPCECLSGKKKKYCHPQLDEYYRPPILKKDDPPEVLEKHIRNYLMMCGKIKA